METEREGTWDGVVEKSAKERQSFSGLMLSGTRARACECSHTVINSGSSTQMVSRMAGSGYLELQSRSFLVVTGERPLDGTAPNACASVGCEEAGSVHEAKAFFRAERGGWSSPPETSYPVRVILCHRLCDYLPPKQMGTGCRAPVSSSSAAST